MLILTRHTGESIIMRLQDRLVPDRPGSHGLAPIFLRVLQIRNHVVRLGIDAPPTIHILRSELDVTGRF